VGLAAARKRHPGQRGVGRRSLCLKGNVELSNPGFTPHAPLFALAAALALILPSSALDAQETVLHQFSSAQPDPQLEEVLYLAAGVALLQGGLSSVRDGNQADYVLATRYTSTNDQAELRYTLYRPWLPEEVLADTSVVLPVDGALNTQIGTVVLRLLQIAGIQANPSPQASIQGLLPAPSVAGSGKGSESAAAEPPPSGAVAAEQPATEAGAAEEPGSGTTVAAKSVEEPPREAWPVKFDSSISASGVLLFGTISEFLHYGAGGRLRAGVSWPQKSWTPTLGAEISFTRAFNDSGVSGGPLYLSTAGAMAQVGSGTSASYRAAVGLSGGAAMITVRAAGRAVTKTVPYADVAVQFGVPVGARVSLGVDVQVLAVFDDDLFILAVAPALTVRVQM
jgi:hypothetical protein